jgi:hypothetical protein
MSANMEEILFKMGIRTGDMEQSIHRMKAEMAKLGEHVNKSFEVKEGQHLVKLFDQIIDKVPILGTAIQGAFNPLGMLFSGVVAGFEMVSKKFQEWDAGLDAQGEAAARPFGKARENIRSVRADIAQQEAEFERWRKDLLEGKPGEQEEKALRERIDKARVEAGGDPIKLSQAKLAIMQEEKAKADAQTTVALGDVEANRRKLSDEETVKSAFAVKEHEAKRTDALARAAELDKKIKEQEQLVKEMEFRRVSPTAAAVTELVKGNQAEAIETAARGGAQFAPAVGLSAKVGLLAEEKLANEKLEKLNDERGKLLLEARKHEEAGIKAKSVETQRNLDLKESMETADRAKVRSIGLEKQISDERKALFDAESKRRQEDTDNAIKQAEKKAGANKLGFIQEKLAIQQTALERARSAGDLEQTRKLQEAIAITEEEKTTETRNKQLAQEKFDRDYAYQQARIEDHRLGQDQISVDELASMPSWQSRFGLNVGAINQSFQHRMDRQLLAMGGGVAGQYSDTARDLQLAQEESKMALLVEGKDSARYKRAKLNEERLQTELGGSGIVKVDLAIIKMSKTMDDLLANALTTGLVVKPNMGK